MTSRTLDLRLLADPAIRSDPYPLLGQLRAASPLTLLDGVLVVAGRHRDCAAVLRHAHASSERNRSVLAPPGAPFLGLSFLALDPPDHTRLRRLVSAAFTPRVVAGLRPRITEIVDQLLSRVADQGRMDVVADLAYPLPVQIISELLGVPPEDHQQFRVWSALLARALDPQLADPDPARLAAAYEAREEFARYFSRLIAARRDHPREDLLSLLVHAESEGDQLTEEELLATCVLLLVAGHETTANLIANAVLALLRHPDQLALLRARPALADGCVEETLRYDAPVQLTTRAARGPLPVGDTEVPDRGVVVLLISAANRDPDAFAEPDRFDITRSPNSHLAFAAGIHFCLGAGLARLESAIALDAFARRVVRPQLTTPTVTYKENVNLRGPARLDVDFAGVRAG
jgi:cytochrome P450